MAWFKLVRTVGKLVGRLVRLTIAVVARGLEGTFGVQLPGWTTSRADDGRGARFIPAFARWRFARGWPRRRGFVIDGRRRISEELSKRHLLVAAPSGAGKTTRLFTPFLLRTTEPSISAVVTDPSGELFENTSGHLEARGFRIRAVNLINPDQSLRYNPLSRATSHSETLKLAKILVQTAYGESRGDPFWNDAAQGLIGVVLRTLQAVPRKYRNLANVRHVLAQLGVNEPGLRLLIAKYADEPTFADFQAFTVYPEKVRLSIGATARTALEPLADPDLRWLTAKDTVDIEGLRAEPTILYLIVPEHQLKYYGFLLSLFYQQLFANCMDGGSSEAQRLPLYVLLDEFGHAKIPDFGLYATTLRKRNVALLLALQDVSQLTKAYGQSEAQTILSGAVSTRMYFPGLSHETCRDLESVLGRTMKGGKLRPLLPADQIRTLPDEHAICISSNKRPILFRTQPFYRNRKLRRRSAIPKVSFIDAAGGGRSEEVECIAVPGIAPAVQTEEEQPPPQELSASDAPDIGPTQLGAGSEAGKFVPYPSGPAIRQAVLLNALDNDALVPLTEMMEALGISRDVAERLRKEKRLRPVVTLRGRNSKMFVTVGHVRNLIRNLQDAPEPKRRGSVRKSKK